MICYFFFNDTATTEIYTLSLHDALPISGFGSASDAGSGRIGAVAAGGGAAAFAGMAGITARLAGAGPLFGDRKSTSLNSSHANISYAVFCLKKKNKLYTYNTIL